MLSLITSIVILVFYLECIQDSITIQYVNTFIFKFPLAILACFKGFFRSYVTKKYN